MSGIENRLERLERAIGPTFPPGPMREWPEAELRRFCAMILSDGPASDAAADCVSIDDLRWLHDLAEAAAAAEGGDDAGRA